MNFGVIGYGYWGPNVVRNLMGLEGSQVLAIAEISPAARLRAQKAYPGVVVTPDAREVLSSVEIDAVAVVSPVWTHYELTKAALLNGKHVFVEKPFTSNAAQGEELINLAQQKNLKIMVDHTFLFTGAVRKISHTSPTVTWIPCRPTRLKNAERKALLDGPAPRARSPANSLLSRPRKTAPRRKVKAKHR